VAVGSLAASLFPLHANADFLYNLTHPAVWVP
jgi:hypothetical protein